MIELNEIYMSMVSLGMNGCGLELLMYNVTSCFTVGCCSYMYGWFMTIDAYEI